MSSGSLPSVVVSHGTGLGAFSEEGARARLGRMLEDGTPPNTRRAYESDLRYFRSWHEISGFGEADLPIRQDVLVRFVVDHSEGLEPEVDRLMVAAGVKATRGSHRISTISRRVSAIASWHRRQGHVSPFAGGPVREALIRAKKAAARRGYRPRKKKAALRETVQSLLAGKIAPATIDLRDDAMILFAFATGGRRRSEVAEARLERLEEADGDYVYHLGVTKTEQEGSDRVVPVAGRAAAALRAWLAVLDQKEGPIFRSIDRHGNIGAGELNGRAVARVIQKRAAAAGLDANAFGGHSMRSGFITETGRQGKNIFEAMALSGHRSMKTVAGYHEAGTALHNEAGRLLEI